MSLPYKTLRLDVKVVSKLKVKYLFTDNSILPNNIKLNFYKLYGYTYTGR